MPLAHQAIVKQPRRRLSGASATPETSAGPGLRGRHRQDRLHPGRDDRYQPPRWPAPIWLLPRIPCRPVPFPPTGPSRAFSQNSRRAPMYAKLVLERLAEFRHQVRQSVPNGPAGWIRSGYRSLRASTGEAPDELILIRIGERSTIAGKMKSPQGRVIHHIHRQTREHWPGRPPGH